jgi:hypothetical protein
VVAITPMRIASSTSVTPRATSQAGRSHQRRSPPNPRNAAVMSVPSRTAVLVIRDIAVVRVMVVGCRWR